MTRRAGGGSSTSSSKGSTTRPLPSREVTISKAMSWVLRHGAEKEGLKLDENGYANVGELLSWQKLTAQNLTFPELRTLVLQNDKQRFTLIPNPSILPPHSPTTPDNDNPTTTTTTTAPQEQQQEQQPYSPTNPTHHLIRASQGHSLPILSQNLLTPLLPHPPNDDALPALAVHGTTPKAWRLILASGGLKPMGRTHVHFAAGLPPSPSEKKNLQRNSSETTTTTTTTTTTSTAPVPTPAESEKVISGLRPSAQILIWVQLRQSALSGSLKWWRSANGVLLTEGDERGMVGLEWVDRVEKRGIGEVVWRPGWGQEGK
ncbi:hypothetical protein MMC12_007120 [Toensbergia leucococca]|nr:hypothetical protein [Toensbergia leucococca]